VVSPESEERDRKRKPQLYAEGGIQYFWRIENLSGKVALYAYELDPATRQYALIGIFRDRVSLALPFEIDMDLTEIDRI
jgi:Uma2 family endonuclease